MVQILEAFGRIVLTLIDAPLDEVCAVVSARLMDPERAKQYKRSKGSFRPVDLYTGYPPAGCRHKAKLLLMAVEAEKEKTVFAANLEDGWSSWGYIVSDRLRVEALTLAVNRLDDEYPANAFTLVRDGEPVRHVASRKEEKWIFFEQGEIQPFENPELYSRRRIKERMTPDEVVRIAGEHGLELADGTFATRAVRGVLFEEQ